MTFFELIEDEIRTNFPHMSNRKWEEVLKDEYILHCSSHFYKSITDEIELQVMKIPILNPETGIAEIPKNPVFRTVLMPAIGKIKFVPDLKCGYSIEKVIQQPTLPGLESKHPIGLFEQLPDDIFKMTYNPLNLPHDSE